MALEPFRPGYRPIDDRTQLRPQAQPVDNYVAPRRSGLQELAASLAPLSDELRTFMREKADKQAKDDAIRGEAAFFSDNAAGLSEGVRTGKIPPQYSPAFVQGFKKSQGNVAGTKLEAQFAADFEAWPGKNSDDPAAFDTFVHDWLKDKAGTEDPDVLRALMPHINRIVDGGSAAFTTYRADKLAKDNLASHVAEANQAVDAGNAEGLSSASGTDYAKVFGAISEKRASYVATGKDPEDFDKAMIDAMVVKVLSTQDPGLLGWFDQKVPGENYTYGDTAYGLAKKQQTLDQLEVDVRQKTSAQAQADKAENELKKDETQRQTIELLMASPNAVIPADLLTLGSKYDPTFPVRVAEWRKNLSEGFSDPAAIQKVQEAILNGGGYKAFEEAVHAGVFGRPEDLSATYTFLKGYEGSKDKINEVLDSASAKSLLSTFDVQTKGKDSLMQPLSGLSKEGAEAQFDFRRIVQDWVIKNPEATLLEREEFIGKTGKMLMDRIKASPDITQGGEYERGDLGFANPYSTGSTPATPYGPDEGQKGSVKPGEVQAPPPPPSSEPPKLPGSPEGPHDQTLRELTPIQRTALEAKAKKLGLDPKAYLEAYKSALAPKPITFDPNNTDLGEGDVASVGLSPAQATDFLDEVLKSAQAPLGGSSLAAGGAGHLLDLIRQHESRGNYNAVYGNANSKVDLSQFSVNEILGQQQAARKAGAKSTAIGANQMIYKTLKAVKAEMGLTGDEKFTPELQDKMGVHLLNGRGLQDFLEGKISKRAFAFRLSQEWAALPNPNTGRSFYANDGLNASSVSPREVYKALGLLQAGGDVMSSTSSFPNPGSDTAGVYRNIPDVDGSGASGQVAKFQQWNNDPVGNHEAILGQAPPELKAVVKLAQKMTSQKFVAASGQRSEEQQALAKAWGWSKADHSDHPDGNALDLWPIDGGGAVHFGKARQLEIVRAMRSAAKELGVELDVGASFGDLPHFGLRKRKKDTP